MFVTPSSETDTEIVYKIVGICKKGQWPINEKRMEGWESVVLQQRPPNVWKIRNREWSIYQFLIAFTNFILCIAKGLALRNLVHQSYWVWRLMGNWICDQIPSSVYRLRTGEHFNSFFVTALHYYQLKKLSFKTAIVFSIIRAPPDTTRFKKN